MSRTAKALTALLLLALLAGGGYLVKTGDPEPAPDGTSSESVPATAIRLERGAFVDRGEYAVRIEASQDVTVIAEAGGKIVEDHISEGDRVAKGQVLYRLEDDARRYSVKKAEAALELARQNLLKSRDASRPELLSRLEALSEESAAALAKAESDAERFETLYDEGAVSLGQKENVELALAAARARSRVAAENLSEARTGARDEDRASAEAAVRQAESALDLARDALGKAGIESPITGIVASKMVFAGDTLHTGQPVAEIVDIAAFKIRIGVSSADVSHFSKGDVVTVEILPSGLVRKAVVRDVGIKADSRSGSFPVILEMPNDLTGDIMLRAGMDGVVHFTRRHEKEALVVPRSSLIEEREGFRAFVAAGDRAEVRRVAVGSLSESEAVVTDGLEEGDLLIVVGQLRLKDGDLLELSVEK
jgi:RND family efflux transporter MFP subunit